MSSPSEETDPVEGCLCVMTEEEGKRIAWLTEHNLKRLGKRHGPAAEAIAVAQVELEHAVRVHGAPRWWA